MAELWTGKWRDLEFRVELRSLGSDGGTTLHIGPAGGGPEEPEWLRFDCFDQNPHWHLAPADRDEIKPLVELDDPVGEVFEMLDRSLAKLLER